MIGKNCHVWNDNFRYSKTRKVVGETGHGVWLYIDNKGQLWKNAVEAQTKKGGKS